VPTHILAYSDASVNDLYTLCAAASVTSLMDNRQIRKLSDDTDN